MYVYYILVMPKPIKYNKEQLHNKDGNIITGKLLSPDARFVLVVPFDDGTTKKYVKVHQINSRDRFKELIKKDLQIVVKIKTIFEIPKKQKKFKIPEKLNKQLKKVFTLKRNEQDLKKKIKENDIKINEIDKLLLFTTHNEEIKLKQDKLNLEQLKRTHTTELEALVKEIAEGTIFDLVYHDKNHNPEEECIVKQIGKWAGWGNYTDGPMSIDYLIFYYDIYIIDDENVTCGQISGYGTEFVSCKYYKNKLVFNGGKTRRRRRAKKVSRKSRSNRKR